MAERADTYTHGHADSVLRSHRWRTVQNSAGYLLPHLTAGASVLDVGCGPGTITVDLARHVHPGRVLGVDAAADVIEAASAAVAEAAIETIEVRVDDVYALAVDDDAFDIVHAHQVLQHLSDPVAALAEMRRVCRPGGLVAARDCIYRAMSWFPTDPRLDRWLDVYCRVAEHNGGEPDAGSRLSTWALEAGFTELTSSASAWCYATPEERAWWGGLWADRITTTRLADQAVELGIATPDDLAEVGDAWRKWADTDGAWFAVLHGEVIATA